MESKFAVAPIHTIWMWICSIILPNAWWISRQWSVHA